MNTIGIKSHKIHILHIKRQYVKLLQKNKEKSLYKRKMQNKRRKPEEKLQIFLPSEKIKLMLKLILNKTEVRGERREVKIILILHFSHLTSHFSFCHY